MPTAPTSDATAGWLSLPPTGQWRDVTGRPLGGQQTRLEVSRGRLWVGRVSRGRLWVSRVSRGRFWVGRVREEPTGGPVAGSRLQPPCRSAESSTPARQTMGRIQQLSDVPPPPPPAACSCWRGRPRKRRGCRRPNETTQQCGMSGRRIPKKKCIKW